MFRRWQSAQHVADVGDEAEIEHTVGLIEDHRLRFAQFKDMLLVVVDDAPRSADQDVDAAFELTALLFVVDATEHHGNAQARVAAESQRVLVDLHSELARRCNDERADRGCRSCGRSGLGEQVLEEGDQEGCGLAGTGLRLACDVATGECKRQGLCLDGRAAGESGFLDALHQGGREIECGEGQIGKVVVRH